MVSVVLSKVVKVMSQTITCRLGVYINKSHCGGGGGGGWISQSGVTRTHMDRLGHRHEAVKVVDRLAGGEEVDQDTQVVGLGLSQVYCIIRAWVSSAQHETTTN